MVGLRMRLLGGFEAGLASGALLSLPTKKAQGLLAYLGTRLGQAHPRDKLAALLWGETSDHQARDNLRHALCKGTRPSFPRQGKSLPSPLACGRD